MTYNLFWFIALFFYCIAAFIFHVNSESELEKKRLEVFTVIVLALFAGLRFEVGGSDYFAYLNIFERCPKLPEFIDNYYFLVEDYRLSYERGYLFFNSLIKTMGFSFHGFILIHSIFFFTCFYYGLRKYSNSFLLVVFIFLYKMYLWDVFVLLRQTIVVGLFFCFMHYIEERKALKYFVCVYICTWFHSTAYMLFPLYLLSYIKLTPMRIGILNLILVPTVFLSMAGINVLEPFNPILDTIFGQDKIYEDKLEGFVTGRYGGAKRINFLNLLEYLFMTFWVVIYYYKIVENNKYGSFFIKLFMCLLPLFTLFSGNELFFRFREYFILSYGFILVYLSNYFPKKRTLIYAAVIIVCFAGFIRFIFTFQEEGIRYDSILFDDVSIFE